MTGLSDYEKYKGGLTFNIEIAILLHDIDLTEKKDETVEEEEKPKYNEDYVDMNVPLEELNPPFLVAQANEKKCPVEYYKNTVGYFYIPVLMPLIEKDEPIELEFSAPTSDNIINKSLQGKAYKKLNYISLVIPKYILLNFTDKVPKDTKFLVAIINGEPEVQNIHIIGIHSQELKLD